MNSKYENYIQSDDPVVQLKGTEELLRVAYHSEENLSLVVPILIKLANNESLNVQLEAIKQISFAQESYGIDNNPTELESIVKLLQSLISSPDKAIKLASLEALNSFAEFSSKFTDELKQSSIAKLNDLKTDSDSQVVYLAKETIKYLK